jgi:hypothetical protein
VGEADVEGDDTRGHHEDEKEAGRDEYGLKPEGDLGLEAGDGRRPHVEETIGDFIGGDGR